jgi:hypothetical protein
LFRVLEPEGDMPGVVEVLRIVHGARNHSP